MITILQLKKYRLFRLFCEPLCRTSLARIEVRKSLICSNVDCNVARRTAIYKTVRPLDFCKTPGLLSGKCPLHEAMNEFFGSCHPAKQKLATFAVTALYIETSTDIIHQSPFLVITGDYVKYINLKDTPREVSFPFKLTDNGTPQYK